MFRLSCVVVDYPGGTARLVLARVLYSLVEGQSYDDLSVRVGLVS